MWIREKEGSSLISLKIQPGAKKDSVEGIRDDRLFIKLSAPPVEGKANKGLIKFLSSLTGLPQSRISLLKGETSKLKVVRIEGMSLLEFTGLLGIDQKGF